MDSETEENVELKKSEIELECKEKYVKIFMHDQIRAQKLHVIEIFQNSSVIDKLLSSSAKSVTTASTKHSESASGLESSQGMVPTKRSEEETRFFTIFPEPKIEAIFREWKPSKTQLSTIVATIKDEVVMYHKQFIDSTTKEIILLDEKKRSFRAKTPMSLISDNYPDYEFIDFKNIDT